MGTLFEQRVRPSFQVKILGETEWVGRMGQHAPDTIVGVEGVFDAVLDVAKRKGVPVSDVLALFHTLELQRANNLKQYDGDVRDEQMAGLGHILESISNSLERLICAETEERD